MIDKPNCRCNDQRCLFYSSSISLEPKFSLVTEKVREGTGCWEQCQNCGLVINRGGVNPLDVRSFYNTEYTEDNSYSKGNLLSPREHFEARIESIRSIANYLDPFLEQTSRVFELGAATGELLYIIKDQVGYCFANEINEEFSDFISEELGIDSSSVDYLDLDFEDPFDCIISINTLDHLYNPALVVDKIKTDLTSRGILYIEVPNDEQAMRMYLPEPQRSLFEMFMYQNAHYYSFSYSTVRKLLTQSGFEIIDEFSKHDYTVFNYLNWYFNGQPQKDLVEAMGNISLHEGSTPFETRINEAFSQFNGEFRKIIEETKMGELLCVLAKKP